MLKIPYKFKINYEKITLEIGQFEHEYYFYNEDIINEPELKKYVDKKIKLMLKDSITISNFKIKRLNKEIEHLRQFLNGE